MKIEKARKMLPVSLRMTLKVLTAKVPILTSLIALLYGYLLIPKSREEGVLVSLKSRTPKLFVIPDIYAVDCFEVIFIKNIYGRYKSMNPGDIIIDIIPNPENPKDKITVPIATLDNIIQELGIKRIDFIKIDAERAELDILKGAQNVLQLRKYLAIAAYHTPNEANEMKMFLEKHGLNVVIGGKRGMIYTFNIK